MTEHLRHHYDLRSWDTDEGICLSWRKRGRVHEERKPLRDEAPQKFPVALQTCGGAPISYKLWNHPIRQPNWSQLNA